MNDVLKEILSNKGREYFSLDLDQRMEYIVKFLSEMRDDPRGIEYIASLEAGENRDEKWFKLYGDLSIILAELFFGGFTSIDRDSGYTTSILAYTLNNGGIQIPIYFQGSRICISNPYFTKTHRGLKISSFSPYKDNVRQSSLFGKMNEETMANTLFLAIETLSCNIERLLGDYEMSATRLFLNRHILEPSRRVAEILKFFSLVSWVKAKGFNEVKLAEMVDLLSGTSLLSVLDIYLSESGECKDIAFPSLDELDNSAIIFPQWCSIKGGSSSILLGGIGVNPNGFIKLPNVDALILADEALDSYIDLEHEGTPIKSGSEYCLDLLEILEEASEGLNANLKEDLAIVMKRIF